LATKMSSFSERDREKRDWSFQIWQQNSDLFVDTKKYWKLTNLKAQQKSFLCVREREREKRLKLTNDANKVLIFLWEREKDWSSQLGKQTFYLFVRERERERERERSKAHNLAKKNLSFFLLTREKNLKLTKMATLEAFVEWLIFWTFWVMVLPPPPPPRHHHHYYYGGQIWF
jgi:hypothetical protein